MISEQDKTLLANASRLIWAKGANNKDQAIVAVNFQDLVERLIAPPMPTPKAPEPPKES